MTTTQSPKIKIPSGTPLSSMPLDTRALLLLVSASERRIPVPFTLPVPKLAQDLGVEASKEHELTLALQKLHNLGYIVIMKFTPELVEFEVGSGPWRPPLLKVASDYYRHVEAKAARAAKLTRRRDLPPIQDYEREAWLQQAYEVAAKLMWVEQRHRAYQVAGCMARIGKDEVVKILEEVTLRHVKTPSSDDPLKAFFKAYCARRDELHALFSHSI
jgi:hypothetical protein